MRWRRGLAAAGAAALGLTACTSPDEAEPVAQATAIVAPSPEPDTMPAPSPTTGPSASPTPSTTSSPPPAATSQAPGFADVPAPSITLPEGYFASGLSSDGTRLYADGPHPEGVGCEESQPYALQLYGIETGELDRALDPSLGLFGPFRGPGERVLLVQSCEGLLSRVATASPAPDGSLTAVEDVPLPTDGVTAVDWTPDGGLVWAADDLADPDGPELWRTDVAGVPRVDPVPLDTVVYDLAATSTGVFGVDLQRDVPTVVDLLSGTPYVGFDDVTPAPWLDAVVLTGDAGLRIVRGDGRDARWIDDALDDGVRWDGALLVDDGLALVVEDRTGQEFRGPRYLHAVTPDGVVETIDVGVDAFPGPLLSADGDRLAYTTYDDQTAEQRTVVRDRD